MSWLTRWRLNLMRGTRAGLIGKRDALRSMFKWAGEMTLHDMGVYVETEQRIAELDYKIAVLEARHE